MSCRPKLNLKPAKNDEEKVIVAHGEVVPADDCTSLVTESHSRWLRETLTDPDAVSIAASFERTQLLTYARLFDLATDAAVSISADNSVEKMLAHQMALAHDLAMKLGFLAMDADLGPLNIPKLTNASVRLMEAFQGGFLALHKIKSGGRQTVVVQHVDVSDGGQAVINGAVGPRSKRRGEGTRDDE